MRLRPAEHRDLTAIRALLAAARLPDEDVAAYLALLIVGQRRDAIVAAGALEPLGRIALLRSVAVVPEWRGRGWGRRVVERLLATALDLGMREVYLLTMDAADYFASLGFEPVPRESAPPGVRGTRQFSGLCPSTAVLMRLALGPERAPGGDRPKEAS